MMLKSGQIWTGTFPTLDATGALSTPSVGPVGVLYVAGVTTADVVTISGANPYKFSVTLPALTAGQSVEMYVTATIAGVATATVVDKNIADTAYTSEAVTAIGLLNDVSAQDVRDAMKLAPTAGAAAAGSVDAHLDDILEDTGTTLPALISTRTTLGSGAITFTYTLTSSGDGSTIADVDVWVTSDLAGETVLASGKTNSAGVVTFYLDAGTVYVWRKKSGWNFVNPDVETVA